jgi:hypothetical protein
LGWSGGIVTLMRVTITRVGGIVPVLRFTAYPELTPLRFIMRIVLTRD